MLSFILTSAATSAGVGRDWSCSKGHSGQVNVLLPCSPVALSLDLELILFSEKLWFGINHSTASATIVPGMTCSSVLIGLPPKCTDLSLASPGTLLFGVRLGAVGLMCASHMAGVRLWLKSWDRCLCRESLDKGQE